MPISVRFISKGPLDQKQLLGQPKSPSKQSGTFWQILEPRWKKVQGQWKSSRDMMSRYTAQISYHVSKAKVSIKEANMKLAEQEQQRADQRLTYDKDVERSETIHDLPSQREVHRQKWARKLEFYLDSLQETIFTATRALNDVTGYSSIQRLRKSIELMETNMENSRQSLKILKDKYAAAIEDRIKSQKQLNELLQRKSTWSPADLESFTQVYKNDALNQKRERSLKLEVGAKEDEQEKLGDDLYRAILTRYHEEQIWSDKIRRTSTWGTFILMGVNIILFLVFQLLLEPWKRKRLTRSFEDKVKKALDDYAIQQNIKLEQMIASVNQPAALAPTKSEELDETGLKDSIPAEVDAVDSVQDAAIIKPEIEAEGTSIPMNQPLARAVWVWIKSFAYKLKPAIILNAQSQTALTNVEFYIYSTLLILLGAFSAKLID